MLQAAVHTIQIKASGRLMGTTQQTTGLERTRATMANLQLMKAVEPVDLRTRFLGQSQRYKKRMLKKLERKKVMETPDLQEQKAKTR